MTSPRSSTRGTTRAPAKPRGAKKPPAPPRERLAPLEVLPVLEEEEQEIPAPPPEPECPWPFEIKRGRCPVAVFNAPGDVASMNEGVAVAGERNSEPLRFERGVLAVFTEEGAENVRLASRGGALYVEGDPRFGAEPLLCDACYPPTRHYSQRAYQRHMKRHSSG